MQLQHRAAVPHLLMALSMVLALTLVLVLTLAPSGMISKKGVPYFCTSTVLLLTKIMGFSKNPPGAEPQNL